MLNLKSVKGFKNLNEILIDEINAVGKIKSYQKNDVAMDSEDTLKYFYIILEGCIKVYQYNPENGKEQTLYLLREKDFFDVLTVLDAKVHEVMSVSLETSKVLELPIEKVREWIEKYPAFNKVFFPYIAKQFREIEDLSISLSIYDTTTRLLRLLLKNIDKSTGKLPLLQKLSHQEIASMIGTARQVVSRQLQALKKEGIVDIKRKNITLHNLNKLIEKIDHKL